MSLWGRALAGAGSAVSDIANKYIDAGIQEQRARVLADLQRSTAAGMRADQENFEQSPDVQARRNANATAATVATAGAADTVALNRAGNTALTQAQIDQANRITTGTGPALAAQAGAVAAAQQGAKPIEMAPGGMAFDSKGRLIAQNTNETPQQVQDRLFKEGLKGQKGEKVDLAYKETLSNIGDRLQAIEKDMNKGLADGTLKRDAPPPKTSMLPWKGDEPGKDPAYDNYMDLKAQRAVLLAQQKRIADEWRASTQNRGSSEAGAPRATPAGADPLGLRAGAGGDTNLGANTGPRGNGNAERAAMGSGMVPPAEQMPDTGEGSQAGALKAIDAELRKNLSGDQRATLLAERERIVAGTSTSVTPPARSGPSPRPLAERAAAANSATPAATTIDSPVIAATRAAGVRDSAANAAAVPGKPAASGADFKLDPAMEDRLRTEQVEMGNTTRVKYSPEVAEYAKRKKEAEDRIAEAESASYRALEFARQQARRR